MTQLGLLKEPETERQRCFRIALLHAQAVADRVGPAKHRAGRACLAWMRKALRS